jgi:hypothetical protein
MKRFLIYFAVASAIFTSVPIILYMTFVAAPAGWVVSKSSEEWARFGDFFGGILGPIYAFLAFASFLVTVHLQNTQIKIIEHRSTLEELQRLLASVSKTIDDRLAEIIEFKTLHEVPRFEPANLRLLLRGTGQAALSTPISDPEKRLIDTVLNDANVEFSEIAVEIHQLVKILNVYSVNKGDTAVSEFYHERYADIVCYLHLLGFIDDNSRADVYFHPLDHRKYLQQR